MSDYKYKIIFRHYADSIDQGFLPGGGRLNSLRKTAQLFNCSLSVVTQAYEELEMRGYIRSEEKSGFFALPRKAENLPEPQKVKHSLRPLESCPNRMISTIMEIARRRDFIPLGATIPALSILPGKKLSRLISDQIRRDPSILNSYTETDGESDLREGIALLMQRKGVNTDPGDIIITNGCTEALYHSVGAISSPGDAIAIESPAYLGVITLLKQLKRKVIEIPTSSENGMDLDMLESVLKKEIIHGLIVSPVHQNPLGFVMSEENKDRIHELSGKYNFPIVEDDVYGDCSFSGKEHRSLKSRDRDGRVLYCSSFSKTIAPGLRIGWIIPGRFHKVISENRQIAGLGGPIIAERSMAEFLRSGYYESHLKIFRKKIAFQTYGIRKLIEKHFPPGTKVTSPEGGFHLWVEMDKSIDSSSLFQWAYGKRIGIIPGPVYSASGKFLNCIRISCGSPIDLSMEKGISELGSQLKKKWLVKHPSE